MTPTLSEDSPEIVRMVGAQMMLQRSSHDILVQEQQEKDNSAASDPTRRPQGGYSTSHSPQQPQTFEIDNVQSGGVATSHPPAAIAEIRTGEPAAAKVVGNHDRDEEKSEYTSEVSEDDALFSEGDEEEDQATRDKHEGAEDKSSDTSSVAGHSTVNIEADKETPLATSIATDDTHLHVDPQVLFLVPRRLCFNCE